MKKLLLTTLALALNLSLHSQVQCNVDITILEGDSISMCRNALVPINASNGYVNYAWSGPETAATQVITPNFSGQYVVAGLDTDGCVSTDTIQVTIHELPIDAIVSSEGDTICGTGGTTLSLSGAYAAYDWGGGITTPTNFVTTGGVHTVNVVDNNSCVTEFSTTIHAVEFQLTSSSTSACTGGSFLLEASGGSSYQWSTSETGNSIVVTPESSTDYSVMITEGTCVETLVITVAPPENTFEYALPDTVAVLQGETVQIAGPANMDQYIWTPGDQVQDSTIQVATFNGTESTTLTLQALHPDGCWWEDQTVVLVIDLFVPNGFSPNGDNINDNFVIPEMDLHTGAVVVWNRWGDIVFQSESYQNDWNGTCKGQLCMGQGDLPEGTYFYQVDILGLTKEGYVTLKR